MNNIKVITLCGSLQFKKEFEEIEAILTQKGAAVLSPIFFEQRSSSKISEKEVQLYKKIHLKK